MSRATHRARRPADKTRGLRRHASQRPGDATILRPSGAHLREDEKGQGPLFLDQIPF